MKKRLISNVLTAIMAMGFSQVHAQTQLVVTPHSGDVGKYAITDIQKITIAADGLHIVGNTFAVEPVWKLSAIKTISFVKTTDGIETVSNRGTSGIKIFQRGEMLYVNGLDGQANVAIYDLNGQTMLCATTANGEGIDISNLTRGVFILKVKNTTFKFIKQ